MEGARRPRGIWSRLGTPRIHAAVDPELDRRVRRRNGNVGDGQRRWRRAGGQVGDTHLGQPG